MTASLNEFGAYLPALICAYAGGKFLSLLLHNGHNWVLRNFAIAGILVFWGYAVQRGWAGASRAFAPEGAEHQPFINEWRWLINFITGHLIAWGVIMWIDELMEIKERLKQWAIYASIYIAGMWLVWL